MCEMLRASSGARLFRLVTLILLVTSASVMVKADNRHSEQIVFSGVGFGSFATDSGTVESPFGFWLWCQSETSGNGIYGADKACADALGLTKGVFGFGANGGVVENADETYTMHVHSADFVIDAFLTNASDDLEHGPSNTVNAVFTAPAGGGQSTTAVVHVTGKE